MCLIDRIYESSGDVHGRLAARPKRKERNVRDVFPRSPYHSSSEGGRNYLNLIERSTYSVQIGDLGLNYNLIADVDPGLHRVIAGNHDNLAALTPHFLGDFGLHSIPLQEGQFDFFFVRGAHSVDIDRRIEGVNWWPEQELDDAQSDAAFDQYQRTRPRIVISHDCPTEIVPLVKLRFFAGLSHAEAAESLGIARRTADRHWSFGRAWLYDQLRGERGHLT